MKDEQILIDHYEDLIENARITFLKGYRKESKIQIFDIINNLNIDLLLLMIDHQSGVELRSVAQELLVEMVTYENEIPQ